MNLGLDIFLSLLLITIILIVELSLVYYRRSGSKGGHDKKTIRLVWSIVVIGTIGAFFLTAFEIPEWAVYSLTDLQWIALCGIIMLGLILRFISILVLGSWFTVDVAVKSAQPVVDSGPYAFVRHPSYTGLLIELFAFSITLQHGISSLLVMFPLLYGIICRMKREEAVLKQWLPGYTEYARRVPWRLIPYIY